MSLICIKVTGKKSKMSKNENVRILKRMKNTNNAAHVVNKSEKKNVVQIEINPIQDLNLPARNSTSLIGKKLHQNLSANLNRIDCSQSNLVIRNQTGKSKQSGFDSNDRRTLDKTFEKPETEKNVDTSKDKTISTKIKIQTKSKDQDKNELLKQSADFYPFTVPSFGHRYSEDLKTEFEMRLADFAKRFSCNSSDKTPCHILFESGQTIEFGKDWVERHIERYILLLMLQKLRAQTAKEKQSKFSTQSKSKEKITYPLFNSVWTPEEIIELRQKIGFMSQNICHTTGYLKNTLYNRKLLKQKELNQFKLLSQPENEQPFFDIKNLFDIDKLSNIESKKQRGWSTNLFKKRHLTQKKHPSTSSYFEGNKNEQNLVDAFYEQNSKPASTIYKICLTLHGNKKIGYEPASKLPSNIWTAVNPRPLVHTKSIPTNDRDYEIVKNSEKNTPAYLQPTHFEKKLLSVRFPVKERSYSKLVTVQNLIFEPESTSTEKMD